MKVFENFQLIFPIMNILFLYMQVLEILICKSMLKKILKHLKILLYLSRAIESLCRAMMIAKSLATYGN